MGKSALPPQGVGAPGFLEAERKCFPSPQAEQARCARRTAEGGCPHILGFRFYFYFRRRRSAARKAANTTEIPPFMGKNAALSLGRSSGVTRECSCSRRGVPASTPT